MWTEVSADAFDELGWETASHYHNVKPVRLRLLNSVGRLLGRPGRRLKAASNTLQADYSNALLAQQAIAFQPDVLLSIQGKLTPAAIARLRETSPHLRIIYWWGDPLSDLGRSRIAELAPHVDRILISYRGDLDELEAHGLGNGSYFPFGASLKWHTGFAISDAERQRFTSEVSFVGTCSPKREALLRELGASLGRPVRVWGRSWVGKRGFEWGGPLTMQETLKVHALSRIAININPDPARDGLNMKAYEIPAAGGFEICDAQPVWSDMPLGRHVPRFRDGRELAELVAHFLAHEEERRDMARQARETVLASHTYRIEFARLLASLGIAP
ncbi:MAG: glycosyltransferase [Gallionellaceae bacterium]|nr:glycosyltransferase [Gallionellaceae bacterium]